MSCEIHSLGIDDKWLRPITDPNRTESVQIGPIMVQLRFDRTDPGLYNCNRSELKYISENDHQINTIIL